MRERYKNKQERIGYTMIRLYIIINIFYEIKASYRIATL